MFEQFGELVAAQMDAVQKDYEGREEDFQYEGSISILLFADKSDDVEVMRIRKRSNICKTCTLKALYMAMEDIIMELKCSGDGEEG